MLKGSLRCLFTSLAALTFVLTPTQNTEALIASVKATGMGAVGVAKPQDALAAAYNPAGITDIGDRIDAGIVWGHDQGDGIASGNRSPAAPLVNGKFNAFTTHDFYAPDFGINKQLCLYGWDVAVGLCVYNRNASKTTYGQSFPLFGTSNLGMEYIHQTISVPVAVKFCDHSFGVSLNYMVQRIKVNGLQRFDNPAFTRHPGFLTNKGYAYSNGVGFTLGWKWDILPSLSVGATFQPRTSMNRFGKYKGFLAQDGLLNIPPLASVGISYRYIPQSSINFDVQYVGWRNCRSIHNRIQPAFNNILLGQADYRLGGSKGLGFGWRSQWIYRVGIDYDLSCEWTVRAGARFAKSTIPASQTAVNLLTNDPCGNFIMGGFSYRPNETFEFSAYYANGFDRVTKGFNTIPAQLGGGNTSLKQAKTAVGLSLGYNY